jgi:hypothetical protein
VAFSTGGRNTLIKSLGRRLEVQRFRLVQEIRQAKQMRDSASRFFHSRMVDQDLA